MKYLSNVDLTLNQIQNVLVHILASDPGSPVAGQIWYNSTDLAFKGYGNSTRIFTRGVAVSAPITKTGTDDNPTIGISAATTSAAGSMSSADKTKLDNAASAATVSTLVLRDASGRAQFADPSAASDVATKNYVDNLSLGLKWKDSVRVATTANITLSGAQTIDSVSVIAGERVLVRAQTLGENNGIYVVAAGSWTRSTDFDASSEVLNAAFLVSEGTTYADTLWTCSTNAPITLGTTSLSFAQLSGGTAVTAGAGLTQTGNTVDVVTASASRIVVNADSIDLATTGVGAGTYGKVTVDTYGRVTAGSQGASYAANIGDGTSTSIAVTHSLNTRDVSVEVYRNSTPWDTVLCDVERTDANTVTLRFGVAPASTAYRVVIS